MHKAAVPITSNIQVPVSISQQHILIIEDNPIIRELLVRALTLADYATTACTRASAALAGIERAIQPGHEMTLILLDLSMPRREGEVFLNELCQSWMRHSHDLPPIIVLTTYINIYDDLPVERVITKPFHMKKLLFEVQQIITQPS